MIESPVSSNARLPVVAVIGASSAAAPVLALAAGVGRALAGAGWHLVCGGGQGVMEAASRGFVEARAETERVEAAVCGGPCDSLGSRREADSPEVHRHARPPPASILSMVSPR